MSKRDSVREQSISAQDGSGAKLTREPGLERDPSLGLKRTGLEQWVTTPNLLGLSFAVQLVLVLYANHVDNHSERYGGLKYTDVDWRVVTDGAKLIFAGMGSGAADNGEATKAGGSGLTGGVDGLGWKRAEGWFINDTGIPIGE